MRIGFDAHYLGARVLGRETYLANLVRRLVRLDRENRYLLYVSPEYAAADPDGLSREGAAELCALGSTNTIVQRLVLLPRALRRDRVDVLYLHTLGVPLYRGRRVVAIHGIHELSYASAGHRLMQRVLLPWTLRSATRIVANSEYTKREIVEGFGVEPGRVRVVYGGVDRTLFHPDPGTPESAAGEPYALYLGSLERRKNLERLIDAFARARRAGANDLALVLAGIPRGPEGGAYRALLESRVRELGLEGRVRFDGFVDPGRAAGLLRAARFLAFPSLHESFGLPPLEAMACGTPVLAGRAGALPEVLGEAPEWCDPLDTDSIAGGILRLASDPALRATLSRRGIERAAAFTWEDAAARTLDVLREAGA